MWEKRKGMIFFFSMLNYWFTCLSSVGSPPFAKIFTLGNNIGHIIDCSRFSNYCRSNCFEWKSLMKHRHSTKSNSPKNWSFDFWSQSNFEFGYRTKWNKIKLSNSELLMASMLIYWSSVKAVKAILILVSFIISIFGVNSKINILCENVNAFVYRKNVLKLQVEIILGIISIIILSCLELQHNYFFWIQHSSDFLNLLLSQSWLSFHVWFFFQMIWFILISFGHQTLQKAVFDSGAPRALVGGAP